MKERKKERKKNRVCYMDIGYTGSEGREVVLLGSALGRASCNGAGNTLDLNPPPQKKEQKRNMKYKINILRK
jgi:hypothetical protein